VIKIERPGEGGLRAQVRPARQGQASYFVWNQPFPTESLSPGRGSTRRHRAILARLAEARPTCWCRPRPGCGGRLGLSAAALRAKNPRLIVCDISRLCIERPVQGTRRPTTCWCKAERAALGDRHAGQVVRAGILGGGQSPPACMPTAAFLAALIQRGRTGEGSCHRHLRCSKRWPSGWATRCTTATTASLRRRAQGPAIRAVYSVRTDGLPATARRCCSACRNEREWVTFCRECCSGPR